MTPKADQEGNKPYSYVEYELWGYLTLQPEIQNYRVFVTTLLAIKSENLTSELKWNTPLAAVMLVIFLRSYLKIEKISTLCTEHIKYEISG